MKNTVAILVFILSPFFLKAQGEFRTVVPAQPVVVGESFQVQYIFPGTGKIGNFKTPLFNSFRFVSGPNQYNGSVNTVNGIVPVNNFVFTLEAKRAGRFNIPGATATINGRTVSSNNVVIEVISRQQADRLSGNGAFGSDYVLRAGEDPYEKIRQNLFLKVMVDRTSCYAGEPILATFKLYSRLQSKSDIIKNPGFYGFTVYDMVNLSDKQMLTEEINGKSFDVHTIRKVQLFPLQEGLFTIDPMEVTNKIEFSRSVVNKRTEQEIVEGVLGNNDESSHENTEVYETKMSTAPVMIRVKALPTLPKPDDFSGAVGQFSISSSLVKNKIAKNEEAVLNVIIRGQGNFTQLNAPVIKWPAGIEGFDPIVKDSIDKTQLPLKGSRVFRYSFTGTKPGSYQLPAISFTYFNPGGNYKTVSSSSLSFEVSNEEKKLLIKEEKKRSITQTNASASRIAAIIIISLVVIIMAYWIRHKKEPVVVKEEKEPLPTVEELLQPASNAIGLTDREFYSALQRSVWNFLIIHFHLSGSEMNKDVLLDKMKTAGIGKEDADNIATILQQCEAGMFTTADLAENKNELIARTEQTLQQIDSTLSQFNKT